MERRLVLYGLEQCAGLACDYERRLSLCKLLLYNSFGFGKVAGVYNCNAVYADSVSECSRLTADAGSPYMFLPFAGLFW